MYSSFLYGGDLYGHGIDTTLYSYSTDLMKYLPYYYQESRLTQQIQRGFEYELGLLHFLYDDLVKQFFVSTATWGLSIWEKELGIITNPQLENHQRRETIMARLRGRGTTTIDMVKRVAKSFSGGDVEIIEKYDENMFIINFVGTVGMPTNMKGFIDVLEMIKPAHLNYDFEYSYRTWGEYKDAQTTWGDMKEFTWDEILSSEKTTGKQG